LAETVKVFRLISCFALTLATQAGGQVPSGVLKKKPENSDSQAVDQSEDFLVPRPILYFDPSDETKTPELLIRVPIKFKAKQQPLMIGDSIPQSPPAQSPAEVRK
jgi:hypothetical protein